jgi:hypothetical protein
MIGAVRPVGYQAADFGWFGIELLDQTADASAAACLLGSDRAASSRTQRLPLRKAVSNPY